MPHSHRSTAPSARQRRLGIALSMLAALVLLLLIAWLWALPAYIDQRLSQALTERSGRQVTIDDVTLTPWRHQVTLDGLRIAGQADTPVFSSRRVVAILDWHSLFEPGWRFERIDLTAPRLQLIWRASGEWNLVKLFGGTGSGEAMPLRITRLTVSDGRLDWINRRLDEPLTLSLQRLDLEARDYDNRDDRPFTLQGQAKWNGGTLKGNGEMGFAPWTLDIELDADQVPLTTLSGYLAQVVRAAPAAGSLGAQIRLRAGRASDTGTRIHGQGEIAGLEMRDPATDEPVARAERVSITGLTFTSAQPELIVEQISLAAPWLEVTIDEQLDTNLDVWRPPQQTGGGSEGTGIRYTFDTLIIERGAVAFTDRHLPRPFEIDFSALNGKWQAINSAQAGDGQLLLEGQVSDGSPLRIEGAFDPLSDALNGNLNLHFERLDLETFAPYLRKFGGYAVEGGQATLNLDYRLVQGRLIAKNHVVLHRLELGEEVNASATDLPLKTLLDVLKSEDGVIELDIPMHLPLDEPSAVDFGSVIGQAIREALENLVTSPLETLSAVVDDDGERRENGTEDGSGESDKRSEAGPALYERARTIQ
ncbi:uncharacterized protein DUF748 [Chromohalobacter marismortui]|uniref:Uncharacterized protein DUF748 n=1 Tax=Chromohalobacter marismortui TaxID=42055 RepID=A0A4R7NLH0_9GAMM|nr:MULTISPECIES: DUF748 domain-containing protein [Chromohalobacter]MCI0510196.1 DUF748 domain-containing protein [Chromohalobacter sp.]MCI0593372.1 DUF748 domain-containing protein [Chromohalobacter sp.]TDU21614.1 uncharacterized protein DUF748 [Chromohalobacter marismortui]